MKEPADAKGPAHHMRACDVTWWWKERGKIRGNKTIMNTFTAFFFCFFCLFFLVPVPSLFSSCTSKPLSLHSLIVPSFFILRMVWWRLLVQLLLLQHVFASCDLVCIPGTFVARTENNGQCKFCEACATGTFTSGSCSMTAGKKQKDHHF